MDYSKLKNSELESLLKERGLPHNGRKAEMVARLQDADKGSGPTTNGSAPANTAADLDTPAATTLSDDDKPTATTELVAEDGPKASQSVSEKVEAEGGQSDATYTANLASTSLDEEIARRKKRAEKFGTTEQETNAIKNLERQKRFGAGPETTTADTEGVNRLDEALPERRARGAKRSRDDPTAETFEDPGLKRPRGGFRGKEMSIPCTRGLVC